MAIAEIEIDEDIFLPAYQHLLESDADINFLWGGRDSGKSHFIAQKLILDCLSKDYFRCILIKKTAESIKDAQWQTIKDIVDDWGLSHLFDFYSSPLEIRCVNGNKFIARGCDKPGKLKSIANPSHAWFEEGNQLTLDDFIIASTSLRSNNSAVQMWFSFNPECDGDYENFWLYQTYFANYPGDIYKNFTSTTTQRLADGRTYTIKYTSTHTTYNDNPYCSPQRAANLEQLSKVNPFYYFVFTKGLWGKKEIKNPWVHNFDKNRHVSEKAQFNPNIPVRFSLDFNVSPMVCLCLHHWIDSEGMHTHYFREIILEPGDVYKMADRIMDEFPPEILYNALFTGDATSRKRTTSTRDNIHDWLYLQQTLHISNARLNVPKANPNVATNRNHVNLVFALHPDLKFHPSMTTTVNELQFTEAKEDSGILKDNREDENQRGDCLDCVRYVKSTWLVDFSKQIGMYKKQA
jgi:hypothetical protein